MCSTIVYRILQSIDSFYLKILHVQYMYMCTSCKSNITNTALIFKHTNHGTQCYKTCKHVYEIQCINSQIPSFTNYKPLQYESELSINTS